MESSLDDLRAHAPTRPSSQSHRTNRLLLTATVLSLGTFALLWATQADYGYAIDEATYLWVAREERAWGADILDQGLSESLSAPSLRKRWHFLEPPGQATGGHSNFNLPLAMHLINLGSVAEPWLGELRASRLASMILFSVTIGATYCVLSSAFSRWHGLSAAVLLLASPRVFGHAHLAATETPLLCFWTLTILSVVALDRRPGVAVGWLSTRAWRTGLLLSLAMAVKLPGWFLAPSLFFVILGRRPTGWMKTLTWMVLLPIPLIIALTPPLWHEPIAGLVRYLQTAAQNPWSIATYFAGQGFLGDLPWWSGPVTMAITIPLATLVFAGLSLCFRPTDGRLWTIAVPTFVVIALRIAGLWPSHDGDRHLIPAYAGVSLMAGLALGDLIRFLTNPKQVATGSVPVGRRVLACAVMLSVFAEPVADLAIYHGHGLCYYNRAVGGLPGAADQGFEISYWFETVTHDDWADIMRTLPPGSSVFLRPDHPGLEDLRRWGIWREDLVSTGPQAPWQLLYAKRAAYGVPVEGSPILAPSDLGIRAESGPMIHEKRFLGVRLFGLAGPGGAR